MHQPTGKMLALGKRMAFGWSSRCTNEKINQFFTECAGDFMEQDDFILVLEEAEFAPVLQRCCSTMATARKSNRTQGEAK